MKYMLLIYSSENAWSPEEWKQCVETSMGICQAMAVKGQFMAASPLHPVATATSVRVRNGQRLATAGLFAETTEQLGGYYLIDVENLDEAIAMAGRLPPAKKGTVEIRPLFKLDGLPTEKLSDEPTASDRHRHQCSRSERSTDRDRWPVRGDARSARRVRQRCRLSMTSIDY